MIRINSISVLSSSASLKHYDDNNLDDDTSSDRLIYINDNLTSELIWWKLVNCFKIAKDNEEYIRIWMIHNNDINTFKLSKNSWGTTK